MPTADHSPASPDSPINAATPYATRIEVAPTREPAVAECQPDIASQVRSVHADCRNGNSPKCGGVQDRGKKRTVANLGGVKILVTCTDRYLQRPMQPLRVSHVAVAACTLYMSTRPFVNLAAYRFVPLNDLRELRQRLRTLCERCQLRGTILLASEGNESLL